MTPESAYAARPWMRHYDYWVRSGLSYPGRSLSEVMNLAAVERPDRPATQFLGAQLTFLDLKQRADALAAALARFGIAKGDRVGIMLPNCPQYIFSAFAVLRLGAIVVNINPSYTAREVLTVATDDQHVANALLAGACGSYGLREARIRPLSRSASSHACAGPSGIATAPAGSMPGSAHTGGATSTAADNVMVNAANNFRTEAERTDCVRRRGLGCVAIQQLRVSRR